MTRRKPGATVGGWSPERLPVRRYKARKAAYTKSPAYVERKRGACARMTVTIEASLARALRETAQRDGPNISAIVEAAIRHELIAREAI